MNVGNHCASGALTFIIIALFSCAAMVPITLTVEKSRYFSSSNMHVTHGPP